MNRRPVPVSRLLAVQRAHKSGLPYLCVRIGGYLPVGTLVLEQGVDAAARLVDDPRSVLIWTHYVTSAAAALTLLAQTGGDDTPWPATPGDRLSVHRHLIEMTLQHASADHPIGRLALDIATLGQAALNEPPSDARATPRTAEQVRGLLLGLAHAAAYGRSLGEPEVDVTAVRWGTVNLIEEPHLLIGAFLGESFPEG